MINTILNSYKVKTEELGRVVDHFQQNLRQNLDTLNYCLNRGMTGKDIENFHIGYDKSAIDFQNFIERSNFDVDLLKELGILVKENGSEDSYYDKFCRRIIFPIQDMKGNFIGLTGRVWKKGDDRAKYINTNLCEIYQKSLIMYGLYQAAYDISTQNLVLVVEGNADVVACHSEGIKIAVCTSGSAFMEEHYLLLRQYTSRFIFCFDNDESGKKTTEKVKKLLENKSDIRVGYLDVGDAKDLDEYIRNFGSKDIKNAIKDLDNELLFELE